jgi:anti-anti-sigma regulatory factor
MLKIEAIETANGSRRLQLEGRLIGPWVVELRRACERALASRAGLVLDLSEVAFVDRDGLDLLCALDRRGVGIDCSGFVAEQLKARRCR